MDSTECSGFFFFCCCCSLLPLCPSPDTHPALCAWKKDRRWWGEGGGVGEEGEAWERGDTAKGWGGFLGNFRTTQNKKTAVTYSFFFHSFTRFPFFFLTCKNLLGNNFLMEVIFIGIIVFCFFFWRLKCHLSWIKF